jgi:hypothetical protein
MRVLHAIVISAALATSATTAQADPLANTIYTWVTLPGIPACQAVSANDMSGPLTFRSKTKGTVYLFARGKCPREIQLGGLVRVYSADAVSRGNIAQVWLTVGRSNWFIVKDAARTYRAAKG